MCYLFIFFQLWKCVLFAPIVIPSFVNIANAFNHVKHTLACIMIVAKRLVGLLQFHIKLVLDGA